MKEFLRSMATRRWFLKTTGAATLALASPPAVGETAEAASAPSEHVRLTINGRPYTVDLDPRTTLLDALREHFALTGSKKGCDQGQCGDAGQAARRTRGARRLAWMPHRSAHRCLAKGFPSNRKRSQPNDRLLMQCLE